MVIELRLKKLYESWKPIQELREEIVIMRKKWEHHRKMMHSLKSKLAQKNKKLHTMLDEFGKSV